MDSDTNITHTHDNRKLPNKPKYKKEIRQTKTRKTRGKLHIQDTKGPTQHRGTHPEGSQKEPSEHPVEGAAQWKGVGVAAKKRRALVVIIEKLFALLNFYCITTRSNRKMLSRTTPHTTLL